MGKPFLAVTGGETQTFSGTIVLVNNRAPPVNHVFLDLHRTGSSGMNCDFQRGGICALTNLLG